MTSTVVIFGRSEVPKFHQQGLFHRQKLVLFDFSVAQLILFGTFQVPGISSSSAYPYTHICVEPSFFCFMCVCLLKRRGFDDGAVGRELYRMPQPRQLAP